jgi:putative flippase GtrA
MLLNFVVTVGLKSLIPGHLERGAAIASIIATFVVAFWNFFGQKYWTFKHKH